MTLNSKNHERKVQRKQKRLQHTISNDSGVICCDEPTRVILNNNVNLYQCFEDLFSSNFEMNQPFSN